MFLDALPLPAMMPAMCVPWPCASAVERSPDTLLTLAITFRVNAGCAEMPESTTATVMPAPVTPGIAPRPRSRPACPLRTWSAAVAAVDTSMNGTTGASPDSTSRSAASCDTCALFASSTGRVAKPSRNAKRHVAMRAPQSPSAIRGR